MADQFRFRSDYQDLALACLIKHHEVSWLAAILKPGYFTGVTATITARAALEYFKDQGHMPSFTVLRQLAENATAKLGQDGEANQTSDYISKLEVSDTRDWQYVRDSLADFARERAVTAAIRQSIELLRDGKEPDGGYVKLFSDAVAVGQNLDDLGIVLHSDFEKVVDQITDASYGISTGWTLLDNVWRNGLKPGWLVVPLAPPKRFKCLAKGTKVMMFDGSLKSIEDIVVGDKVMGDDSTARTVHTCGSGIGQLYQVEQQNGDNFICNDVHALCVMAHDGAVHEIEAETYYQNSLKDPRYAGELQAYKVGVEFPEKPVELDPYFLGLWLGDGSSRDPSVTVGDKDPELITYLNDYAASLGLRARVVQSAGCSMVSMSVCIRETSCRTSGCTKPVRAGGYCIDHYNHEKYHNGYRCKKVNTIRSAIISLNVKNNKHIPDSYKFNSRDVRLKLLAGLIDSDGSALKGGGFMFVNSNSRLAADVCWLARSLGFRARSKCYPTSLKATGFKGKSWYTYISGPDLHDIPTKVPRKKGKPTKRRYNRYKLKLTPVGIGEYFGIQIDGNRRFLMGDFTCLRNTGLCVNMAVNMVSPSVGEDVVYYACEISQELAMLRAMCSISGMTMDSAYDDPANFKAKVKEAINKKVAGNLIFKTFSAKQASISEIKAHLTMLTKELSTEDKPFKPKAVFIDYAETVAPDNKDAPDYRQQAGIYVGARSIATEFGCTVIMPDRCNRETVDKAVPDMKSFQGAFEKAGAVDVALGLCSTEEENLANKLRLFVFLNRHGRAGVHLMGKVDPERWRIEFTDTIAYEPEKSEDSNRKKRGGSKKFEDMPDDLAGLK